VWDLLATGLLKVNAGVCDVSDGAILVVDASRMQIRLCSCTVCWS